MRYRAFTLIELLVVVVIIAILAGLVLGGLSMAREQGRAAATRATIAKIDAVLIPAWESFRTRRLPVGTIQLGTGGGLIGQPTTGGPSRAELQQYRWNARRDLMRLDLPDRLPDVENPSICIPDVNGNPYTSALQQHYRQAYQAARGRLSRVDTDQDGVPDYSPQEINKKILSYEQAELLYMTVLAHGGNEIKWRAAERGDTDNDGLPEFLDGWGRPIWWLRWPAGWPAADLPPVSYDPTQRLGLDSIGPRPIIMSAGPDGLMDVNRGVEPDGAGGWQTYTYGLDVYGDLNPWTLDENSPPGLIGAPIDASSADGKPANGRLDHFDNLSNYGDLTH